MGASTTTRHRRLGLVAELLADARAALVASRGEEHAACRQAAAWIQEVVWVEMTMWRIIRSSRVFTATSDGRRGSARACRSPTSPTAQRGVVNDNRRSEVRCCFGKAACWICPKVVLLQTLRIIAMTAVSVSRAWVERSSSVSLV